MNDDDRDPMTLPDFVVKVNVTRPPSRGKLTVALVMPTAMAEAWPAWATHAEIWLTETGFDVVVRPGPTSALPAVVLPWQEPS